MHEKHTYKVEKDNGDVIEFRWSDKIHITESDLPFLRNPIILIGQKDLTSLSYLNEPEVLYNLQIRFLERREIYTYCGIVLVAINPYKELPIYGNCIVDAYHSHDFSDLDPHIFAVGENAFRRMSSFNENQSIIVSGESGAGKTVSAKYTMRYFALVGGSKTVNSLNDNSETKIERKVLSSNPIMEAFGNAKTVRNDNSSRFGKYLEIEFNRKNQIISANMRTYLLEKSRVVFQNLGERNYHIFYQLVCHSQCGDDLLVNTGLVDNPDNYIYLNSGESLEIDGLDDRKEFLSTKDSFLQLGFSLGELQSIFEILAALLHLGNIRFISNKIEDGCEIENVELLRLACHQLGCLSDQMEIWLRFRSISTLQETLHKPLTKHEAGHFRDALVKSIYTNLFIWIVKRINQSFCCEKSSTKSNNSQMENRKFIGVLDIYGFETFEENSFEQFCINFANEKLQQQFNLHVFKLEQEEYIKEGLEWTIIDYYNNQPCIDLIEAKLGLFDLLDEECKMLKGSDDNWCCKIYSHHLKKSKHFSKPKMSNSAFIIHHFAGQVQYECCGFIEKNRDTILEEQINLLKASDVLIIAELYAEEVTLMKGTGDHSRTKMNVIKFMQLTKLDYSRKMKRTVGHQFRNSLKQLMDTLNKTNPHYVRCIKPNDLKLPFTFCPERAVQQLRACGVLETIRLSAAGYPSRWAYDDFYPRYCILLSRKNLKDMNVTNGSQKIVQSVIKNEDAFRFGYKKLFFRPGHVAYLEKLRCDKINESVTLIQKIVRGWLAHKKYIRIHSMVIKLQSIVRRKVAIATAKIIRRNKAATKLQALRKMYVSRTIYNNMKKSASIIQRWWRLSRRTQMELNRKRQSQVIVCQSFVRTFICRRRYLRILRGIILLQSHYRRRKAKIALRLLKLEAKSVYHIKMVNKGLENKIIELTQRLDEKSKEICTINNQIEKNKRSDTELQKQIKLEATKAQQVIVHNFQNDISQLKKEISKEIVEKKILYMEKESLDNKFKKKIVDLEEEIENLTTQVETLEKEIISKNEEIDKRKKCTPDIDIVSREQLIKEQMDHQRLIQDYDRLDMKYQNLCHEYHFMKSESLKTKCDQTNTDYSTSENESTSMKDDADIESFSEEEINNNKKIKRQVEVKNIPKEKSIEDISRAGDLTVIMQLQMLVSSSSEENNQLRERIQELENKVLEYKDRFENQSKSKRTQDMLNMELYGLMKEIKEMDSHGIVTILIDQISDLKKQLLQQMDDCQRLKTSMFSGKLGKLGDAINMGYEDAFNEEEELKLVFESQKAANRKMLKEIDEMRSKETIYKKEVFQLKRDKEHLHLQMGKLGDLIGNLKLTPKERVDKFIQNEFSRILSENMNLRESTDKVIAESIRLKRGLKYFAHRLQKYEGPLVPNADRTEDLLTIVEDVINKSRIKSEGLKEYIPITGLIDLNLSELPVFIKTYITEMNPNQFSKFEIYHVTIFVIFMISKKYDSFKEEDNIIKFLTKVISTLKSVIRKHKDDLDFLAMYISNIFCLLNLFRQYNNVLHNDKSKDVTYDNLRFVTFDLSQFIHLLEDLCISIFQFIMTYIKNTLLPQSLCIDAILLYEGIKTLMTKECLKDFAYLETQPANTSFNVLIRHLQSILDVLTNHKVPLNIVNQIFFHITYLINAYCLNTLLFRTDLCYFSKGVQIKFNLSNLENWFRNQNLGHSNFKYLQPMVEAVQLLQTLLKSDEDAEMICKMCDYLNSSQIIKLLHNFNPLDGWGCSLPCGLIANTEAILSSKESGKQLSNNIETPTSVPISIELPFIVNTQRLNEIVIPPSMYLPCMKILTDQDLH